MHGEFGYPPHLPDYAGLDLRRTRWEPRASEGPRTIKTRLLLLLLSMIAAITIATARNIGSSWAY